MTESQSHVLTGEEGEQEKTFLLVAPALDALLRATLANHFPRSTAFGLLLLHITQFEHIPMPPTAPTVHQRLSCHAPPDLLEQILSMVSRTLRVSDEILKEESGTGAAILFPDADLEGLSRIAQRVLRCINLLQAETIIPPLQYETEVSLGFASFPWTASSLETLVDYASQVQERIIFRPALPHATQHAKSTGRKVRTTPPQRLHKGRVYLNQAIPFMQIPVHLPARLKQLIPYSLALKLRCAPVGRDHQRLTVAMANPEDLHAIDQLQETTGMIIFPVSCEISALEALLASGW